MVTSQEYSCLHSYDPGVSIIAQIQPRGIYHCPVTTRDIHMNTITTHVSFSFNSYDQGKLFIIAKRSLGPWVYMFLSVTPNINCIVST